jgi:hypothetical protein
LKRAILSSLQDATSKDIQKMLLNDLGLPGELTGAEFHEQD